MFRGKHLLRGSIVLSHCVLPPVHIGQDLVYSGIIENAVHFLDLLVGMSSGMLGLENSNPCRKLQFVVLDLQSFWF